MSATKRTSSPDSDREDGSNSKRPRYSDNEGAVAGYIEKVYMKNFMCHSALEVTLNKRINFVVGRNGSGKSAILAAVVIALGCRASSTNRASSLKDFVKNGANSATVQVTLTNEGLYAYKQEVYGSKIIVVRNIYSGSTPSTYKFKSARGEVISTKREELQKIITAFNIQVDNPICALNQDTARTFLASSDTKTKYAIFMKATRLEDVDQLHVNTLNTEANANNRLKLRKESMLQHENEIKDLEKKANALNKLKEIKKKTSDLENELIWALARDEEKILAEMQRKMDKRKDDLEPLKQLLEGNKEKLEKKLSKLREMQSKLEEIDGSVVETTERLTRANGESKEAQIAYGDSMRRYVQLCKQTKQTHCDIQTVQQEIDKHKGSQENAKERMRLTEAIDSCKSEQNKVQATQQTVDLEYHNLRGEYDHFREQELSLKSDRRAVEATLVSKKNQLDKLKVQSDNLTMYGDWMPRLLQRVEECYAQGKFVRKPLGPLGALLKVQDAQWARAIELEIGSVLRSFACHCGSDSQLLRNLFREVQTGGRNPGILVSKFTDKIHDIRNTSVQARGYKNIFDILQISDKNVANFLIDNSGIEGILLIPTGKEASRMMSQDVPKNCKKAITLSADQYFPYPDYRMYAGNQRARVSLLQISKEDVIRELEGELEIEHQNLAPIDSKLQELNEKMHINKTRLKEVEKRIMELRNSKSQLIAQMNELESALDLLPDPQHFRMLATELAELKNKIQDVTQKEIETSEETNKLDEKCKVAKETCEVIRAEMKELQETREKMQLQLVMIKESVRKENLKMKDSEAAYAAHCNDLNELTDSLKVQDEKTKNVVKKACDVCPARVTTKRRVQVIQNELTDCKSYQNMVEEENGETQEVVEILKEKKKKFEDNIQRMNDLEDGLKTLVQSLLKRKKLYKTIRRIMAMRVLFMFQPLLTTRGYKGDMNFNHEARTLEVDVSPTQETGKRETKSLSGGERSYSTVTFILSLWECVEPPFYFMDEFDVFMDKVNRRVVIDMLLMQARLNAKHQYVFFTPQDTSAVLANNDITIHKLDDPERMNVH